MPLNHLKLIVSDLERSEAFYRAAFDLEVAERDEDGVVLTTPGTGDVLTLAQAGDGEPLGLDHLGFFGHGADDFDAAVKQIEEAGGRLLRRYEPARGERDRPTAFFADPDGFSVQI